MARTLEWGGEAGQPTLATGRQASVSGLQTRSSTRDRRLCASHSYAHAHSSPGLWPELKPQLSLRDVRAAHRLDEGALAAIAIDPPELEEGQGAEAAVQELGR